jgi:cell division protein FtsN
LAIQGIQSQLSEISSEGNTLWRVRVGPYNSIEESNPVRDKLNSMGIKPSVIKSGKS